MYIWTGSSDVGMWTGSFEAMVPLCIRSEIGHKDTSRRPSRWMHWHEELLYVHELEARSQ